MSDNEENGEVEPWKPPVYPTWREEATGIVWHYRAMRWGTTGAAEVMGAEFPEGATGLHISLPTAIAGLPVKSIGKGAFSDNSYYAKRIEALEALDIPEGVVAIGEDAFWRCETLRACTLPTTLRALGAWAFVECKALETIAIPDGVPRIGKWTFQGCENLREVRLPAGLTEIGRNAFWECKALREVDIPKGVRRIREHAFWECTALERVSFPETLEVIENGAFQGCSALREAILPDSLWCLAGDDFFSDCTALRKLRLPPTLTELSGLWAFKDCHALREIVFPPGLRSIPTCVLSGCAALERVTLPDALESIESEAFAGCLALRDIDFPPGLRYIEDNAFTECVALERRDLPPTCIIGHKAFVATPFFGETPFGGHVWEDPETGLRWRYHQGAGDAVFVGWRPFLRGGIPEEWASIGAVEGALPEGRLVIPARIAGRPVRGIMRGAFQGCRRLEEVVLPEGLAQIGPYAFDDCVALRQVNVTPGTRVWHYAFDEDCEAVKRCPALAGPPEDEWPSNSWFRFAQPEA